MSWESSIEYYRIINEEVRARLGGTHSARSVMYSVDFHQIEQMQAAGDWVTATKAMVEAGRLVQSGGAGCLLICANTMHLMAEEVQAAIDIPLLHIADATAGAVRASSIRSVALLGTRYTMEQDFYRGRLEERHELEVLIPDAADRQIIHDVIYDELVQGTVKDRSRREFLRIIEALVNSGAQGVIAGCTEIELLVGPEHVSVPYFPTTRLHALAAVEWSLADR
jgi:aspartate racemase